MTAPVPGLHPIRGLTDRQRSLLCALAVWTVADRTGCSEQTAADALDELAGRGEVALVGDSKDIWLVAAGLVIVHARRDWLVGHAHPSAN